MDLRPIVFPTMYQGFHLLTLLPSHVLGKVGGLQNSPIVSFSALRHHPWPQQGLLISGKTFCLWRGKKKEHLKKQELVFGASFCLVEDEGWASKCLRWCQIHPCPLLVSFLIWGGKVLAFAALTHSLSSRKQRNYYPSHVNSSSKAKVPHKCINLTDH